MEILYPFRGILFLDASARYKALLPPLKKRMSSKAVTTFVTAFLDLREDRSKDKSAERCFTLFEKLSSSGIPIHLFLSRSFVGAFKPSSNVKVEWLELEELETYKEVVAAEAAFGGPIGLPHQRTSHHDTRNFMILMNAKAELVARAAKEGSTPQYSWIDFSICHVFQDVDQSLKYLQLLAHTRLKAPVITFPGCWYRGAHFDNLFGGINWRFCGGFFIGDKDSVLSFDSLYRREFPKALAEKKSLTWEVNFWHWLECTADPKEFAPVWFPGDHNDTIIRAPQTLFYVAASLTTIPPRLVSGDCRKAIDSLIGQVDSVVLTVPLKYERFPEASVELPHWLSEPPYKEKVKVVRPPEDKGPALKYLGALDACVPSGSLIFVCDDDQEYSANLVQRMLGSVKEVAVFQNHFESIRAKTSGGLVHGYVGNMMPKAALAGLEEHPLPAAARFVDDQWISIFFHKAGVPVLSSGVELYSEIFSVLEGGWHEKLGVASLSGLKNREAKVAELAETFGVRFEAGGKILDIE